MLIPNSNLAKYLALYSVISWCSPNLPERISSLEPSEVGPVNLNLEQINPAEKPYLVIFASLSCK